MKKVMLYLLLMTVATSNSFANDPYTEQMSKYIQAVYSAETSTQYQDAVNAFERIAAVEKTKWEPLYYSAFGLLMMANKEADAAKKDVFIDKAMETINKGKEISPKESELIALEGFANMIRVSVDPVNRGPKYSGIAFQLYNKAMELNPDNPRALAFTAQLQFRMAKFMNAPTTEACSTANKSLEKFNTYTSTNLLAPKWGKTMTEKMLETCK